MASKKDIKYSFTRPYSVTGLVNQILGLDHKTGSQEEDEQEYRDHEKRRGMKTDCVHIDICALPIESCNDDCDDYEAETHPFAIKENRDCEKCHNEKNN